MTSLTKAVFRCAVQRHHEANRCGHAADNFPPERGHDGAVINRNGQYFNPRRRSKLARIQVSKEIIAASLFRGASHRSSSRIHCHGNNAHRGVVGKRDDDEKKTAAIWAVLAIVTSAEAEIVTGAGRMPALKRGQAGAE